MIGKILLTKKTRFFIHVISYRHDWARVRELYYLIYTQSHTLNMMFNVYVFDDNKTDGI